MKNMISQLFAIACAIVFFQLPIFVDQYLIRLEGHYAESQRLIAALTEAAHMGGKSLDQYIAKFEAQKDKDFQVQGQLMGKAVERNLFLERSCAALRSSGPFSRPVVFLRCIDSQVLSDAWHSFIPGFSLTLHVAVFGVAGWLFGWAIILTFGALLRKNPD